MTRREKLQASMTDDDLWSYICPKYSDCRYCPVFEIREKVESREEFKAWLDEEVEEDEYV